MRIGIALLLTALTAGAAQAALGGDIAATRTAALLTFVPPKGGICAVRADGSYGRRLTAQWRLSHLTWSPNGRHVAFVRANGKIFVADARGKIRWRFGSGSMFNGPPVWSPDGQHIAYTAMSTRYSWLSVARRDGSDDHAVSGDLGWPPRGADHPSWSPDGQRIAFDSGYESKSIYSVRIDGSDRRLLGASAAHPAYSPDGTKLAYVGYGEANRGVFVANADGSDPHRVSSRAITWDGWGPSWSPDGSLLAFAALASPEVVVAKADGSGERVIAVLRGANEVRSTPQWSPDGQLVAFAQSMPGAARPARSSIAVARADGDGWRVVVSRVASRDLHSPAWRPAVALPVAKRAPCRRH